MAVASIMLAGCFEQPDKTMDDKLSFYGIDLRTINKLPECPASFYAPNPRDRSNLSNTSAQYTCKSRGFFGELLIPKEQNFLKAVYVNFMVPISDREKNSLQFQFESSAEKEVWQYLIDKYGESYEEGSVSRAIWVLEEEGVTVSYRSIYWPTVDIFFPRANADK